MGVLLFVCFECFASPMCMHCVPNVRGGQKRALDSLILELEMVVNHQVSAETEPFLHPRPCF